MHVRDAQELQGVISAREFVWWFNGHPDAVDLPVDLSEARLQQCHLCPTLNTLHLWGALHGSMPNVMLCALGIPQHGWRLVIHLRCRGTEPRVLEVSCVTLDIRCSRAEFLN